MKNNLITRSISLILTLVMLLGVLPTGILMADTALAAEADPAAEPTVITLDFNAAAAKGKAVNTFSEAEDGWAYNASASSSVTPLFYQNANWDYKALRFTQTSAGGIGALSFTAPVAGTYKMEMTYCVGNNCTSSVVEVGGTSTPYFAYAPWGTAPKTLTVEGVKLNKGSNPMSFTTAENVSVSQLLIIKQVVFTLVEEASADDTSVITLDFNADAHKGKAVSAFTEEADGWAFDASASSNVKNQFYTRSEWDYNALRFDQTSPDGVAAISFTAPKDGAYTMELTYVLGNSCSGTVVEVGGTVTQFNAWANWGAEPKTVATYNVALQKGSNQLTITNTSAASQLMVLKQIVFTRTGDIADIPKTKLNVGNMSWEIPVGEAAVYDGKEKSATLVGTLPEGVEVVLSGNKATEIGTYTAKAEFVLANGYSADRYEIVGTNPLTKEWKIAAEPASGLLIDLYAVANNSAALKTYGVTGNNVSELGWGFNTDETTPGKNPTQTFTYYVGKGGTTQAPKLEDGSIPGVYFAAKPETIGSTINFYVPTDGYYRTEITTVSNQRCGDGALYVDGIFVGDYAGFAPDAPAYTNYSMNVVYLTKGVHKLNLHPTRSSDRYSNYFWMYLNRIEFVKQESAQEIAEIKFETKKERIYIEDDVAYTVAAIDKDGREIYLGADREGILNYSVTSSDASVLKVENGRIYALKEGEADITVTVKLPNDEKTITKTIKVEGEPDAYDFEFVFDQAHRGTSSLSSMNIDDNGYAVTGGTSGAWFSSWADEITFHGQYIGLVRKQLDTYTDALSIDFKAPATGDYRIDLSYVLRTVGGDVKVYLDGEYIGMYNGYSTTNWSLAESSLTTVHLERNQVYRLSFMGVIPVGADNTYIFLNAIRFKVSEEEPVPIDRVIVNVGRSSMAVGEDCTYGFTVLDANRNVLPIDMPLKGYQSKYFAVQIADESVATLDYDTITAVAPGTTELTMTVTYGGATRTVTKTIEVNRDVLGDVNFFMEVDHLVAGETVQAGYNAKTNTGRELNNKHLQATFASSDEGVATIDATGLVTAVSEGEAQLTITVTMADVSSTATIPVYVSAKTGKITVSTDAPTMSMRPDDEDGIGLIITGVDAEDNELDLTNAEIVWEIVDNGIIEIKDGRALPIALGNTTVLVTVTMPDGTTYETKTWISVNQGKVSSTYYTEEKRAAAQSNVLKYAWANALAKTAITNADHVVENLDAFYDMLIFEGIPRADGLGMREDPLADTCPICGVDTLEEYGHYSWLTDPLNEPFKVRCPACKSAFPSNDFESFYKCGLDAKGQFSEERAMANGGEQYLVNELYPEKGPDWGVDRGRGWFTGESYINNAGSEEERVYAFIPMYHATALWNTFYQNTTNGFRRMLNHLRDAYLYTGDMKYGRAGAILTDRLADIYATMNLTDAVYHKPRNNISAVTPATLEAPYYASNDGNYAQGGILGCISEGNFIGPDLIKAYDAFYPAFDDPEVVAYLAQKAVEQELVVNGENPKDTPAELRQNGIDNILHKVSEKVRTRDAWGNFGLPQAAMALAAVVLDSTEYFSEPVEEPLNLPTGERRKMNSNEMIAWLYEDGAHAQKNMYNKIVESISRDGHGDEVSPDYHYAWYQRLIDYADALNGYEGYPGADLYQNPKFIKMLVGNLYLTATGNTTLQNGDSGSAGGTRIYLSADALARAFSATGNVELAQALYFFNGETTKGLVGNIFDPEADRLGIKVQAIIDEYGPYDVNSSVLLPGYGQALLKWGNKLDGNQGLYSLWFGRIAGGHGNKNALDINIFAHDLSLSPSLGYPRAANSDQIRALWERGTISRNTVIIDDRSQENYTYLTQYTNSDPYHFEDAGRVKVMDAEAVEAYKGLADEYRRTIVAVQGDEDAFYAVDFFNVIGGSTHLYSYHAASLDYPESDGVHTVKQEGGSYAGADVPYGSYVENGYSYLYDVETDNDPANNFYLDYTIYDHNHLLVDGHGLHLRLNMLSTEEEPFTEVSFAKGHPPIKEGNPDYYPYALIRKDSDNSLFTAVHEPYKYNRYLESMELVDVEVIDGTFYADDRAAAVKVNRVDGKVEYIVYCTNYDAVLRIDNRFDFSGFVGVVTYESAEENAQICYRYGMEATIVAGQLQENKVITGKVVDFNRDLSYENYIEVTVDQDVDPETLVGRVIYVQNDGEENGAYTIKGVSVDGDIVTLDLDDQHLVRSLKDPANVLGGFYYNIAVGQSYRIPLSESSEVLSFLNYTADQVVKAGYKVNLTVGVAGSGYTYEAEGMPNGMKCNSLDGTITWTTSKTQTGRYPITVNAIDADGAVCGSASFVIYVVSYTGSTYDASACNHAKAATYEVDGVIETVCPACGTISKTAADEEPEITKFDIAGSNMTLGNELILNIMFSKTAAANYSGLTMQITQTSAGELVRSFEVGSSQWESYNVSYYKVPVAMSAKQMSDELRIVFIDGEGNVCSNEYTISIRAYAHKILDIASMPTTTKTVVVDMLNYGAAVQKYFGYNTSDLANCLLTDQQKALATPGVEMENNQVTGANFYSANLSLEDRIQMNIYFKGLKGKDLSAMYGQITFTDNKGVAKSVDFAGSDMAAYNEAAGIYRVAVKEIVLADSKCPVTVTVYNADGTVFASGTDSVESIAYRASNASSTTDTLKEVYDCIMRFASSAYIFVKGTH